MSFVSHPYFFPHLSFSFCLFELIWTASIMLKRNTDSGCSHPIKFQMLLILSPSATSPQSLKSFISEITSIHLF